MWYIKRQRFEDPEPLKKISEKSLISNLGHMADSISGRFSCDGKLKLLPDRTVSVVYKTTVPHNVLSTTAVAKAAEVMWCSIQFPGSDQTTMSKLLNACTVASFGYKGDSVIDKNYRNAFKLDPKDFATTFQLCDTPILGDIGLINPNCAAVSLQAELYKLNIYVPGDFFKSHVDTPRSGQMFGSLVVCLPTQFSGGELVVRHQKKEIKYDWSSTASDPLDSLCWAAFFSDIEHEVLPVTEGYRVTLTYNLYYGADLSRSTINITSNPFFRTLQAVLSNPMFMRDGGVLGFNTHYSYTFDLQWTDLFVNINFSVGKEEIISKLQNCPIKEFINKSNIDQERKLKEVRITGDDRKKILQVISSSPIHLKLKGADYIIFNSAKLLGLHVHIKPLLNSGYALRKPDDFKHGDFYYDEYDDEQSLCEMFGQNLCKYRREGITWCQNPHFNEPAAAMLCYGNEPRLEVFYKAAVILIGIPNWSKSRQQLVMLIEGKDQSGTSVKIKDNVKTCFASFSRDSYSSISSSFEDTEANSDSS
ncbi:uncharacterized protein [Dysidea avara]|uniref:uncharacterized protein n=1 Tax=Dysidea avara TaxID=196820 RepID=UPI00331839F1